MVAVEPWPCDIAGDAKKPALILLHGFLGRGADWTEVMDSLGQDFFCIAPDMPGHGRNLDGISPQPLSFRRLSSGLLRFMKSLQIRSANLAGYSLGGRLALYFALAYPGRVRALVLESASPGLAGQVERRQRRQLDDRRATQLLEAGMGAFLDDWYAMPLFASLAQKPGLLEAQKSRCKGNQARWMARVVSDLSPGRQPNLWNRLGRLEMPVLLITGELDSAYTAMTLKAAAAIPQADIAISPAAGHNVHLEAPGWFNRQLHQFLTLRSSA